MLSWQTEFQANQQALDLYFFENVNRQMTTMGHWDSNTPLEPLAQLN